LNESILLSSPTSEPTTTDASTTEDNNPQFCLDPLEDALIQFLQVYQSIPLEERPLKLQCLNQRYESDLLQEIGSALSKNNKNSSLPFLENEMKNIPIHQENVPIKLDWNVIDFFTDSTADESGGVLADKDMELWNSTIQDFLVFDD